MFGKRKLKQELDYKQGRIEYLEDDVKSQRERNEAWMLTHQKDLSFLNNVVSELEKLVKENEELKEKDKMWQEAQIIHHNQINNILKYRQEDKDKAWIENQALNECSDFLAQQVEDLVKEVAQVKRRNVQLIKDVRDREDGERVIQERLEELEFENRRLKEPIYIWGEISSTTTDVLHNVYVNNQKV